MIQLSDFLNIKNSTRALSDTDFESILPDLAQQLSEVDYTIQHSPETLRDDWVRLQKWDAQGKRNINSKNRIGIKLCEHFFPGIYSVSDAAGKTFHDLWKDHKLLQKVLKWNRKGHSTPYLSELKRGVYFCGGLVKTTMYRPQLAKMVTLNHETILDPCAGWGGRLLGTVANGNHYVGFEPNTQVFEALNSMVDFLDIREQTTLICDDALNLIKYELPKIAMVLTSPPYFNLEKYTDEPSQSICGRETYEQWYHEFLEPVIQLCLSRLDCRGLSCWNVSNIGKYKLQDHVQKSHTKYGYHKIREYNAVSSPGHAGVKVKGNKKKTTDSTIVFEKIKGYSKIV